MSPFPFVADYFSLGDSLREVLAFVVVGLGAILLPTVFAGGWWWIFRPTPISRENKLRALEDATALSATNSAIRLLVVRAIDDEASLALALGTIVNYLTAITITFIARIFLPIYLLLLFGLIADTLVPGSWPSWVPDWAYTRLLEAFTATIIILASVLILARSVHGRELAVAPMECQINTQSALDAVAVCRR
jgi:hypothetical protein